jgi:hypothetical protein
MKTREDFLAAANEAYRVYEKFMFMTATDFFGIAEPTHEKVDAFHEQQPIAHTMTDAQLSFAVDNFSRILMAEREIYVNASANTQELLGGLFDLQGLWIAWTGEPAELPKQVRLGDLTMDAEWFVFPRYVNKESDSSKVIAGVELHCTDTGGSRERHHFLLGHVSERMGAPLARYDAADPLALPGHLLWMGVTVDVELECHEFPEDPDEGTPGYRLYKLTISRKQNENGLFHFGYKAERLLKD